MKFPKKELSGDSSLDELLRQFWKEFTKKYIYLGECPITRPYFDRETCKETRTEYLLELAWLKGFEQAKQMMLAKIKEKKAMYVELVKDDASFNMEIELLEELEGELK